MEDKRFDFLQLWEAHVAADTLVKLTLSKQRQKNSALKNVYVRPIEIKSGRVLQFNYRYTTRDEFKNLNRAEANTEINRLLEQNFFYADLINTEGIESLKITSGGVVTLASTKNNFSSLTVSSEHNREKKYALKPTAPYWHTLGITNLEGEVLAASQKKYKQVEHYIEMFSHLLSETNLPANVRIADFGCGKGYLTFALFDYLSNNQHTSAYITGYELREKLVQDANKLAVESGFTALTFEAKDINNVTEEKFDVLIALHACDIATDIAIAKGVRDGAQLILVAPCCHKQVRRDLKHTLEDIQPLLKFGIMKERVAETLTDVIRALYLEYLGYTVKVQEFISVEHTPKNVLITAVKSQLRVEALSEIMALKATFGLKEHYLEMCLRDLISY